ncbi:response regulator [Duganella sp. FT135W]|uniref:Response regulator n=1 Tax=Duganella flavida TaxID=2692175 RepID=A0A6L8KBM2_9BURK|nr:response regulator [Duganella flavida]MYM24869.1 response regulator [Duganella flavida]
MNSPAAVTPPAPDWPSTALGDQAHWPPSLRLAVDIMLNSPQAMLLMWGEQHIMVYNPAYAELIGLPGLHAPGAQVPSVQPAAWSWNSGAIAEARAGHSLAYRGCSLPVCRNGGIEQQALDLYYTPVRVDSGVAGILCTLTPSAVAPLAAGGAPLRLLVVEDNADARYLVCETLRALGHEVEAVASGEEALPQLASQTFDVLFTDVSLPGISGVELARRALAQRPQLALMFASGYGDELTRRLEFPARSLQKPYDIEQLQVMLEQIAAEQTAR